MSDGERLTTLRTLGDASPAAASEHLLFVIGDGRLLSMPLPRTGQLVIGRAPGCDVHIDHPKLSRRHAVLLLEEGRPARVQDLGSMNGTRVARTTLHGGDPVALVHGEGFQVGPFSLLLVRPPGRVDESSVKDSHEVAGSAIIIRDPTGKGRHRLLDTIARSDVSVLVLGETGVGKEVLAQTLHRLSGRKGPLLGINCAAVSEALLESELFGHERGAFTGAVQAKPGLLEAAAGGTVFLDEVGEMTAGMQAKLLRAIESREVTRVGGVKPRALDVRFVAATHRDLPEEVARGAFRADLFYRLHGVSLYVPPLRERRASIVPLAMKFLDEASRKMRLGAPPALSQRTVDAMLDHAWPGNVRELRAACERALLLTQGRALAPEHLGLAAASTPRARSASSPPAPAAPAPPPGASPDALSDLTPPQLAERERIVATLAACAGNQTRAAKQLGIARATLVTKLIMYRIPRPRR